MQEYVVVMRSSKGEYARRVMAASHQNAREIAYAIHGLLVLSTELVE